MTPLFRAARGAAIACLLCFAFAGPALSQDAPAQEGESRHEGYYYPPITGRETYPARADTLPDSGRSRRLGFIVGVTKGQMTRQYPPPYSMFAKGTDAEKLIIVSLSDGFISNIYQARALLSQMTSVARDMPLFVENQVEDTYTFLDLLKLMGFTELTITNGDSYSYRYDIE